MANFFAGMAFPFFSVVGSFLGLVVTLVLNPYLYEWGILTTWQKGETTVQTMFNNNIDFYLSFGISASPWRPSASGKSSPRTAQQGQAGLDDGVRCRHAGGWRDRQGRCPRRHPHLTVVLVYVISSAFYIWICGFLLGWDFRRSRSERRLHRPVPGSDLLRPGLRAAALLRHRDWRVSPPGRSLRCPWSARCPHPLRLQRHRHLAVAHSPHRQLRRRRGELPRV